ncbi:MAG TPA: hypothetical protein VFU44_07800, partial [Candidatus Limnocylindria bacterium]|nr:hypothetical protein [Candidatus Limnocylindria bacterium]
MADVADSRAETAKISPSACLMLPGADYIGQEVADTPGSELTVRGPKPQAVAGSRSVSSWSAGWSSS